MGQLARLHYLSLTPTAYTSMGNVFGGDGKNDEKKKSWIKDRPRNNFIAIALLFLGLCVWAIATNKDASVEGNECGDSDGWPTISSSFMRKKTPFRGIAIELFTFAIYVFMHVKDKALLLSLHLFMLAFVVNMKENDSNAAVHLELVLTGAVVIYISVVVSILLEHASLFIKIISGVSAVISFIFGCLFCSLVWQGDLVPCEPTMWYEYVWLGLLFASTIVIVETQEKIGNKEYTSKVGVLQTTEKSDDEMQLLNF